MYTADDSMAENPRNRNAKAAPQEGGRTDEPAIRALIEAWAAAARKGDIERIMAFYAPDVLAFDAIAALQFRGADAYRKHWQMCIAHMPGGEAIMEVHDLGIHVSGHLAVAHYLSRCGYTDDQGKEHAGWMRATVCCRRTSDGWRIAHEHYSLPFDPVSNKALADLTP